MKAADTKKAIHDMADYSQKWNDGTSTRKKITETFDRLAAIQAQLNNLGRGINRLYDSCWNEEEESKELQNLHVYSYESSILEDNLPQKEKHLASFTLPCFINNMCFNKSLADLGASVSIMPFSTYTTPGLGDLIPTRLIVELAYRTVKCPKGIAENVLVGIDKFTFRVDFVVLDMPKDIKTPLILGRPFLSTAHAKIDVSQDPDFRDFLELNDLNEPLEIRRDQVEDLGPTIEEGEVIDAPIKEIVKNGNKDKIINGIEDYPSFCDHNRKIHVNSAHNLKFSCMIGYEHVNANFFPLLSINMMSKKFYNSIIKDKLEYKGKNIVGASVLKGSKRTKEQRAYGALRRGADQDFAVLEDMDAYRDEEMGDEIVGKEFCKEIRVEAKRFKGMITIHNDPAIAEGECTRQVGRYALTKNPTIYVSPINQFWHTASTRTLDNGEIELHATVNGQDKTITEASVGRHLKLADDYGISTLPTTEIFEQLALMGYVTDSDKLTFQKGHFSPQWRFFIHTILHCLSPKKTYWE
ncbi:reverse transcriptase domain-containing protein [Tanacetum coccineum]